MTFVTVEDEDHYGIVLPTPDGGTEVVYLARDLKKDVLRVLQRPDDLVDDVHGVTLAELR